MEKPDSPSGFANDVLNSLTAHIAVLNSKGIIVSVNEAWRRFARENSGEREDFYVGANYLAICEKAMLLNDEVTPAAALSGIQAVLRGVRDHFALEYPCNSPNEKRWFVVRVTRYRREATASVIVSHEDISARKLAEEELLLAKKALEVANSELQQALARERLAARTDYLTGVSNRRSFLDLAAHAFKVASRYRQPLSVILFDIDHFKQVNDTLGHQVGDEILKSISHISSNLLREADVFARYGGDEFIILLPDSDAWQAIAVAERIRKASAAHTIDTDKGSVGVTISAGIADMLPDETTLEQLIRRADQALYAAKKAGRNQTIQSGKVSEICGN